MPHNFGALIAGFVSWFKFDVVTALKLGCLSSGGYISSLAINISCVAAVTVAVLAVYLYQARKASNETYDADDEEAAEHLRQLFRRFAKEDDAIELAEMEVAATAIDPSTTSEQVITIFQQADTDNSGSLSFEEFRVAVDGSDSTGKGLDLGILVRKK